MLCIRCSCGRLRVDGAPVCRGHGLAFGSIRFGAWGWMVWDNAWQRILTARDLSQQSRYRDAAARACMHIYLRLRLPDDSDDMHDTGRATGAARAGRTVPLCTNRPAVRSPVTLSPTATVASHWTDRLEAYGYWNLKDPYAFWPNVSSTAADRESCRRSPMPATSFPAPEPSEDQCVRMLQTSQAHPIPFPASPRCDRPANHVPELRVGTPAACHAVWRVRFHRRRPPNWDHGGGRPSRAPLETATRRDSKSPMRCYDSISFANGSRFVPQIFRSLFHACSRPDRGKLGAEKYSAAGTEFATGWRSKRFFFDSAGSINGADKLPPFSLLISCYSPAKKKASPFPIVFSCLPCCDTHKSLVVILLAFPKNFYSNLK